MDIITDIEQLHDASEPVKFITNDGYDTTESDKVIADIKETLIANKDLLAIAAPQIGHNKRIFGIKFDDTIKIFINPIITKKIGQTVLPETCASLPNKEILIGRPSEITVVYYTDKYTYEDNKLLGEGARLFDQMCQILDGVLPSDFGLVSDVNEDGYWKDATDAEYQSAKDFYVNTYVPTILKQYEQNIQADDELSTQYKQLKFTENVINDRIKVVDDEETKMVRRQNYIKNKHKQTAKKNQFKQLAERASK